MEVASGRRSHRKSRTGCFQCKRRKIKVRLLCSGLISIYLRLSQCDENKPFCRNCIRHGVNCSFTGAPRSLPLSRETSCIAISLENVSRKIQETFAPDSILSYSVISPGAVSDMALLHHYMVATCYTLSQSPSIQAIWRDEVPRIGFTIPTVLHALLAVAALHLSRSDRSRRASCIIDAERHYNTAIHAFMAGKGASTPRNGVVQLFLSSLTCTFACANESVERLLVFNAYGDFADWVVLFRAMSPVVECDTETIWLRRLEPLFVQMRRSADARRTPQALELGQSYIWELKQKVLSEHSTDARICQIYADSIDELGRFLGVAIKQDGECSFQITDIFSWLIEASNIYLELLKQKEPTALIIFGHYIVVLRRFEWMWWMKELSGRLMTQIYSLLSEKHRSWLKWPQQQMGWVPPNLTK